MNLREYKKEVTISILVIITFVLTFFVSDFYAYIIYGKENFNALSYNFKVILCNGTNLLLCFLLTYYLASFSFKRMLEILGLSKGVLMAFILALLAALPHLIGMQYLHGFNKEISFSDAWIQGIHPGYHEEIIYRGFVIGILVRYAKMPAIIPLILSSVLFALGHLYQAHNISESFAVFCTAFGAGTGFFFFYKYTNWNLWFPLFLHSFMDTATTISNWQGTITMSLQDNVFRGITILITIFISYKINKKVRNKSAYIDA